MRGTIAGLALCAVVLFPGRVFAQAATANLTGTVKDASGGVLPGVTITARNAGTNETRTAVTSEHGLYRVTSLPRGTYDVTAELQGFKTVAQSGVLLTVGETVRLDFRLEVGAVAETIQVVGESPLVNTEEGRLSYLVDERRVAELPLNGRNAFQLMELQPGATGNPGNVVLGGSAGGNTAFVNGQRNRANNFLLDGTDNNDQFTAGRVAVNPNVDVIQEFRVSSNNFSAEFGRNSAAAVNVVTKAGTNEIHVAYARGDLRRAEELERRALSIDAGYFEAWNTLGAIYVVTKQPDAAIDALRRATSLNPRSGQAFYNLALAFGAAGRREEAAGARATACSLDKRYCRR